jgi:transposase-like protein
MLYGKKNNNELYSCHEHNEKKRCPKCGSLETKKIGFINSRILTARGYVKRKTQRFFCKECFTSFTDQGYNIRKKVSDDLKRKSVLEYVTTKGSMSDIGKRYGISKMSILNWLEPIAKEFPELEKIKRREGWSGYIQIDGKELKLRKQKRTILIATDSKNGLPITYEIYNGENKEAAKAFLLRIKEIYPVPIAGITSDFGRGKCFIGIVEEIFPEAKHQVCLVHYDRYVWLFLPRTKRSRYYWRNRILKMMIKNILRASTKEESKFWLEEFKKRIPFFKAEYHRRFIKSIVRNYSFLTAHYDDKDLVKYTNIAENINRQLERKLKNTDGFKTEANLSSFLKIWFNFYKNETQLS